MRRSSRTAIFCSTVVLGFSAPVLAQGTGSTATQMWGVAPSSGGTTANAESAAMHYTNGVIAGQANGAHQGRLVNNGLPMSIQSIGSQSVISTTIYGDDNTVNTNAEQTTSNSGDVSNDGSIDGQ